MYQNSGIYWGNPEQSHKQTPAATTAQLQMKLASGLLKSDSQPDCKWHYQKEVTKLKGASLNYVYFVLIPTNWIIFIFLYGRQYYKTIVIDRVFSGVFRAQIVFFGGGAFKSDPSHLIQNYHLWAGELAQGIKVFAPQVWQCEFDPWDSQ